MPSTLTAMLFADSFATPHWSWNIITLTNELTAYPYMRHAFLASAIIALLGAVVGWFAVVRAQTYATHTISMVGFPGAAGAALLGLTPLLGFFAFCLAGAVAIPALTSDSTNTNNKRQSAAIGAIQSLALALGLLFVSLSHTYLNGVSTFLFGTFTGITRFDILVLSLAATTALLLMTAMRRPLLFASVDAVTAQAAGVNVRRIEILFLVVLALAVAEASQFTGALLAFTLTVTPAAIGQLITARPAPAVAIAVAVGIVVSWGGLVAAYFSTWPVGFFVTTFAFVLYLAVQVFQALNARGSRRIER